MPGLILLWQTAPTADPALFAATLTQACREIAFDAPSVVASGMAPPNELIP